MKRILLTLIAVSFITTLQAINIQNNSGCIRRRLAILDGGSKETYAGTLGPRQGITIPETDGLAASTIVIAPDGFNPECLKFENGTKGGGAEAGIAAEENQQAIYHHHPSTPEELAQYHEKPLHIYHLPPTTEQQMSDAVYQEKLDQLYQSQPSKTEEEALQRLLQLRALRKNADDTYQQRVKAQGYNLPND